MGKFVNIVETNLVNTGNLSMSLWDNRTFYQFELNEEFFGYYNSHFTANVVGMIFGERIACFYTLSEDSALAIGDKIDSLCNQILEKKAQLVSDVRGDVEDRIFFNECTLDLSTNFTGSDFVRINSVEDVCLVNSIEEMQYVKAFQVFGDCQPSDSVFEAMSALAVPYTEIPSPIYGSNWGIYLLVETQEYADELVVAVSKLAHEYEKIKAEKNSEEVLNALLKLPESSNVTDLRVRTLVKPAFFGSYVEKTLTIEMITITFSISGETYQNIITIDTVKTFIKF